MGEALRLLGRHPEALEAVDRAIEREPDNAYALGTRGLVLRALGRREEAVEALCAALRIDPTLAWAQLLELGETLRLLGWHAEALEVLDRAIEREPDNAYALGTRGQVLRALGRREEAVEALCAALRIDSALGWARLELAKVLQALGKDLEAVVEFDRCLTSDSSTSAEARLRLGGLLCELDYVEEAVEDLGPLTEDEGLSPDLRAVALATQGQALSAMGRYKEADVLLRRAIALEGGINWFDSLRGWVLENLGRGEEALVSYRKGSKSPRRRTIIGAAKLWGGALYHPWCRKGVGNALYLLGRLEEANQEYRQVIETVASRTPGPDADSLCLLGWCHYRLGEYDKALRKLMQALSLEPTLIFCQFDIALVLLGMRRDELALREYKRAIEVAGGYEISRRNGIYQVGSKDLADARRTVKELKRSAGAEKAERLLKEVQGQTDELLREMEKFWLRVHQSIEISAPTGVVWKYLSDFGRYPEFCCDSVRAAGLKDNGRVGWKTVVERGGEMAWDAEILESFPNRRLSWRSTTPDGWCCSMTIAPLPNATWLIVHRSYVPEMIGPDVAAARNLVAQRLNEDLERLKRLIESRELDRIPFSLQDRYAGYYWRRGDRGCGARRPSHPPRRAGGRDRSDRFRERARVFISYSYDSDEHAARVLALADALCDRGIDVILDRYVHREPEEGWPRWMDRNLDEAPFVLMVCTAIYRRRVMGLEEAGKGPGARFEGGLIFNRIRDDKPSGSRFIPILLLPGSEPMHIPNPIQRHTHYRIATFDSTDPGFEALCRHLTKQPATPSPVPGPIKPLSQIQRPQPSPGPLPPSGGPWWNVPYLRNPYFTGRAAVLAQIEAALASSNTPAAQSPAIAGLGGVGKTQTAIEYAYRHRDQYRATLWVRADTETSLVRSYNELAEVLGLPVKNASDINEVCETVRFWLGREPNYLLILDNADDPSLVERLPAPRPEGPRPAYLKRAEPRRPEHPQADRVAGHDARRGAGIPPEAHEPHGAARRRRAGCGAGPRRGAGLPAAGAGAGRRLHGRARESVLRLSGRLPRPAAEVAGREGPRHGLSRDHPHDLEVQLRSRGRGVACVH